MGTSKSRQPEEECLRATSESEGSGGPRDLRGGGAERYNSNYEHFFVYFGDLDDRCLFHRSYHVNPLTCFESKECALFVRPIYPGLSWADIAEAIRATGSGSRGARGSSPEMRSFRS